MISNQGNRTAGHLAVLLMMGLITLSNKSQVDAKRTYRLESKPALLKAPMVSKYDCRNCLFDDTLNYACLEHSIDVKVGWEVKQRWEVANDIYPVITTGGQAYAPNYPSTSTPAGIIDVGYKYRWRIQPYSVVSFNARPNIKIDRLFQTEAQVNLDQVKSFFYFDLVYYQRAVKYDYSTATVPATATAGAITDDGTRDQYKLLGQNYNGKLCLDIGYNTEDLLLTLKSAVNWKDCYKNLLYTVTDFSNWLGPKAQWIDFCDFHTDEDFLMYSYNPFSINKDTGDVTLLWFNDKVN